jgi:radical SAM protein with 4Fe4S-binding SPASM domain
MDSIDFNKRYYINPAYIINPDKYRAVITNSKGYETIPYPKDDVDSSFCWILHPVYAAIFSFFDGSEPLCQVVENIAIELNIDKDRVHDMFLQYINNQETRIIHYMKDKSSSKELFPCNNFAIPRNFIVECTGKKREDLYSKESFYIRKDFWEFDLFRLSSPILITLMLNNTCVTDCIYCYANKLHKVRHPLTTEKILSLIKEADKMGVLNFELAGGEILLHKDYDKILLELYKHNYICHLSTKMCLTEDQINTLKKIGIDKLQISVDAWNSEILKKMLHVQPDYFNKLQHSLHLLEKYDIKVSVKAVITKLNTAISDVSLLLNNLVKYKNIRYISVAPGECSLYKDFNTFKTTEKEWLDVSEFVTVFGQQYSNIDIRPQGYQSKNDFFDIKQNKKNAFHKRGVCSGNISNLYILPDGQVTICEELYWHPKFIVGDVTQQSIQEIWDSNAATSLYHLSQSDFPEGGACKSCTHFRECRSRQGVCWKMIFQAYGKEAWYNPDPRCPLAPPPCFECYR